jgi:DNA helicase-2/ATP-dependent DNA helicase PcrA
MTRAEGDVSDVVREIIDKPFRLSDEQRNAVLSNSRYTRVIAGAGAGKTETITRRIAYLILVKGIKPASIVAFTFTNRAAQSMKSRIYQRVEEIAGAAATAGLGEMYVGTIHAYAKQVLDDYFGYGNYGVLDDNQEIAYLMRNGWGLSLSEFGRTYSNQIRNFLRTLNMVQSELLEGEVLAQKAPAFFKSYTKYLDLLEENKHLTFGLMISKVVEHLRKAPKTLDHVTNLIVDEYQDINRAQQEFINLIAGEDSIFIVGDPRQSIYQWRGSDERFFGEFAETYLNTDRVSIMENHRSTKRIVLNANRFTDSFTVLDVDPMESKRDDEGYIGFAKLDDPDHEAAWIADQIEDFVLEKGKIKFSDIGILTRSVSTAAGPLIDEFRRRRIPYIVGGKVGLFKRDEAQALGRIFAWFLEDGFWVEDPYSWEEQVTGDDLLTSALDFWGRAHIHGVPTDAERKLRELKSDLVSEVPEHRHHNLTEIYQHVLLALGFERLDYTDRNDAAIMANLGRFNTLLTDFETANRIGGRSVNWQRDLKSLCWFMNSHGLKAYEEQPSEDIRSIDAVKVMTIHQAKGLEWPLVFVFSLTKTRFPPNAMGRRERWCDIPRTLFDAERYEGGIEDERRLFYVAITRARDALLLSYFGRIRRLMDRSPLLEDVDWDNVDSLGDSNLPEIEIETYGVGEEIQTFTAGEIITYNICPHMYLLRELWGYQPGLTLRLGYGRALHHCLRRAGELVKEEGYNPSAAVMIAIDEGFHMPFVGGKVLKDFRNRATEVLLNFNDDYGDDLTRIEEVEYRLEFPIQGATVMGKVDVILGEGGELEVRDYKSARRDREDIRTHEEAQTQVLFYSLGLLSMDRNVTSGSVAYLSEPRVEPVTVDEPSLKDALELAEETVERIVNQDFVPCSGNNCSRCDFISICRWSRDE